MEQVRTGINLKICLSDTETERSQDKQGIAMNYNSYVFMTRSEPETWYGSYDNSVWKGPQEVHLVHPPAQSKVSYETRPKALLKALSCLLFRPPKAGDCTTSPSNVFQHCTSLVVLKLCLQPDLIVLFSAYEGGSTSVLSQSFINAFTLNMLSLFSKKDP